MRKTGTNIVFSAINGMKDICMMPLDVGLVIKLSENKTKENIKDYEEIDFDKLNVCQKCSSRIT